MAQRGRARKAAQGWHGPTTVKNSDPLLTLADAVVVALVGKRHAAAAAAAAANPGAVVAPKVPFAERLKSAGYERVPSGSRPTQDMVDKALAVRDAKGPVAPYFLTKLEP